MAGVVVTAGCASRKRGNWEFLGEDEAKTLAAICDQIVPADDFPSASQVGVLTYIDRQLTRHFRRYQKTYRDGLEQANLNSRKRFGKDVTAVSSTKQLQIVSAIEQFDPEFFDLLRSHTLEGYYGSPRHGGNRNAVSWHMLGLDVPPIRGRAQYDLRKGTGS
ncbi:MAG: gluconate 2-dehydrogenase subunit 3 family protein [Acidobacteriaceae bacterium]